MEKKKNNFSILVLTDFSESSRIALRNAAKFAKLVNGSVGAYHVRSLQALTEEENHISLSRRRCAQQMETHAVAEEMLSRIAEEEGVEVKFSMDFGNVKNCVMSKVNSAHPDLLILGKRKSKVLNVLGDRLTRFVIKNCQTSVLVSSSQSELHSFSDLSLGFYGESVSKSYLNIIDQLQETTGPIKYFGIQNQSTEVDTIVEPKKKERSFIFSQEGEKAVEALISYVSRTNTQLFCIPKKDNSDPQPVMQMVNSMDVPILIYR